ncbi:MAG: putative chromate transport protein [Alphaproteobacteria bacterium UBA4588]|nr:MAG: putative chromate transport protein [Alphaproteobacteria bacterium UBA4588]
MSQKIPHSPLILSQAGREYLKVGLLSFGGPAAQIALMHKVFVEDRKWLTEKQYLSALNFCMLLPGPEAMQLSAYIGWRLHGVAGGLLAGLLFILPGALIIACLAIFYVYFGDLAWLKAAFLGVKAAVIVIVIQALIRVSKKALIGVLHCSVAIFAFIGIFVLEIPYPLIVIISGVLGFIYSDMTPDNTDITPLSISLPQTILTFTLWLMIWLAPLMIMGWMTNWGFLYEVGAFFSKLATVTFGGAYAVLAYMSQEVVFDLGWLTAPQMMDALGFAETTPGPLILVTEFVGFVAGYKQAGLPLAFAAAFAVLWATFAPCFLWIFVGAPYIEWISAQPRLKGALSTITAAVVGVILSLSIWFGLHAMFGTITKLQAGIATFWVPDFHTVNVTVVVLTFLAAYLAFIRHLSLLSLLGISAALGLATSLLGLSG